jgi:manganese transport protein
MDHATDTAPAPGWRRDAHQLSLSEVHRSVPVPQSAPAWRKMLAFAGPGFLIAVGYMDPGNWATDLQGGAQFGYTLLSMILISNFMAILLQHLCVKLGVATGRDLAQACRDNYPMPVVWFLWVLCEIAIAACDLAEVIGSAIALKILFHIPMIWGCIITCADVLAILYLQNRGFRIIEALIITLIATISICFAIEIFWSGFGRDGFGGMLAGFIPHAEMLTNTQMLYVGIGILGATVMPHNLYLHSAIVQTRAFEKTPVGKREAIKFATIDSTTALMFALLVNAVAAPPRLAPAGHRTGGDRRGNLRRQGGGRVARLQPGDPEHATRLRHLAAHAIHQRPREDGRIRQRALAEDSRLADGVGRHPPQRQAALRRRRARRDAEGDLPRAALAGAVVRSEDDCR